MGEFLDRRLDKIVQPSLYSLRGCLGHLEEELDAACAARDVVLELLVEHNNGMHYILNSEYSMIVEVSLLPIEPRVGDIAARVNGFNYPIHEYSEAVFQVLNKVSMFEQDCLSIKCIGLGGLSAEILKYESGGENRIFDISVPQDYDGTNACSLWKFYESVKTFRNRP